MSASRVSGWISLPVLFAVAVLGWCLMQQSKFLRDEYHWSLQHEQLSVVKRTEAIYRALLRRRQAQGLETSACEGFCSLSELHWRSMSVNERPISYHITGRSGESFERWCATEDLIWAHCWWHRSGRRTYATVYIDGL